MSRSRAERRHHVERIANNRRPLAKGRDLSDNQLATRHPLDCGRRCFLCHYAKLVRGGQRRADGKREWKSNA